MLHAVDQDPAFARLQQSADDREQGRLATAARPDDPAELAVRNCEIQAVERKGLSGSGEIGVGKSFAANALVAAHRLIVCMAFCANCGATIWS